LRLLGHRREPGPAPIARSYRIPRIRPFRPSRQWNLALAALAVALIVVILISLLPDLSYRLLPWVDTSAPFPTS
jgi:hypothetical protein